MAYAAIRDKYSATGLEIHIEHCNFQLTGSYSVWPYLSGVMYGRDNVFGSLPYSEAAWASIQSREGINPTSIASGATLNVDWNYNVHHVSGTAQIVNVYAGGFPVYNRVHSGTMHLIADASWSLANTGNILPKTTAPRTVNEVVTLVHDPVNGKWFET